MADEANVLSLRWDDEYLHSLHVVWDEFGEHHKEDPNIKAVVNTLLAVLDEVERLHGHAKEEATFIRSLDLEAGYPELTAALDRMEAGWRAR